MATPEHVLLLVQYHEGKPAKEPVHAEPLGGGVYRLLYSPGFVQGIAAGDEFRLVNADGAFDVLRRAGNLAVQVFSPVPVQQPLQGELVQRVERLGGVLDGRVERGLVFTIPVTAGFREVEQVFNVWVAGHPGWEWVYGNAYDPADGVTPLKWWESNDGNG